MQLKEMPQYPNITRDSCFELSKETFAYALNISYCWRVVAFVKGGSGSDCGRKHLSFSIPIEGFGDEMASHGCCKILLPRKETDETRMPKC